MPTVKLCDKHAVDETVCEPARAACGLVLLDVRLEACSYSSSPQLACSPC